MEILKNISLKPYNTFGIDVNAKHFVSVSSEEELITVLKNNNYPKKFILGGGSNMLLTKDIDALVIQVNLKGISILENKNGHALIKANAGENWHQFVLWTLENDFGGIENLSLIPGNVGSAPIQNIGAYGVELKDVFHSCRAIHIDTQEIKTFSLEDCRFGYRNSIFKTSHKGQYIITSLSLKLTTSAHQLHTEYGAIQNTLNEKGISKPSIQDISKAVISIRQSKLPDPDKIGNSGSFFKNPVITDVEFNNFISKHPEAPHYKVSENQVKIPAGWLIEQAGFKGKRFGDAGVHKNQALVLVNHGNATGKEILNLANTIISTVKERFGITLEQEVNII
ncbi:UDP-N-acetylmuramate dehydrogenase [Zhouia amylolytica]|uniref:UDP-N-acetylenolpyruvoylglucosamine reductase n=1 Tax=Zhouia amylolytica AD3 TaxID=1286632 RepID=W2USB9_9FLAO|nr:UDP-N-acetylmuramate dehydrogenase [Zhouia amylolytica]ETN96844.1 UDP-N-acetylenolpyruvoylglucosamine reductase [Zhouia amylolytica AD3]